jgi:hypothetical protein
MLNDPHRVISLALLFFCQISARASEVVVLKNCESAMLRSLPERYSSSVAQVMLDQVIDGSYGQALALAERDHDTAPLLIGARIVDTFKENFEVHMLQLVRESGENLAAYSGRLLNAVDLQQVSIERSHLRFWRPYLDLRVRELSDEIAAATSSAQKYDLAVRQSRLRASIERYVQWTATGDVHIDWSL